MNNTDIRWIQRFENFTTALVQLTKAVELSQKRKLSDLEEQGLIQAFEFTHELAWKTLKDFLNHKGNKEIYGSKDAVRKSFQYGLIEEGDIWMDMINSRNKTSHTYDQKTAEEIVNAILQDYHKEFIKIQQKFSELKIKEQ